MSRITHLPDAPEPSSRSRVSKNHQNPSSLDRGGLHFNHLGLHDNGDRRRVARTSATGLGIEVKQFRSKEKILSKLLVDTTKISHSNTLDLLYIGVLLFFVYLLLAPLIPIP